MGRAPAIGLGEADLGFPSAMGCELRGRQRPRPEPDDGVRGQGERDVRIAGRLQHQPTGGSFEVFDGADERGFRRRCGSRRLRRRGRPCGASLPGIASEDRNGQPDE